jgi:hypothetical protein
MLVDVESDNASSRHRIRLDYLGARRHQRPCDADLLALGRLRRADAAGGVRVVPAQPLMDHLDLYRLDTRTMADLALKLDVKSAPSQALSWFSVCRVWLRW